MTVLLAVALRSIGHPHLRTSIRYAREISDGVEAEEEYYGDFAL
jgi:hypothetical protein